MENQNQNQKKNPPQGGDSAPHKNNRPRHRGYFIEPPANKPPRATAPGSDGQAQKPPANESRGNDRAGKKPTNAQAAKPAEKKPTEAQASKQSETQTGKPNGGNRQGNNHNRNRNKSKKPQQKAAQPAEQAEKANRAQESGVAEHREPMPQKDGKREDNASRHRSGNRNNRNNRSNSKNGRGDVLTPMPTLSKKPLPLESDDEYEEVALPAYVPEQEKPAAEEEVGPMVEVVGIRFKNAGKTYYFAPGALTLRKGDHAIVETARGQEYGEVSLGNTHVKESATVPPLRPILRLATKEDHAHHLANQRLEEDAFRICNQKIAAHGLDMKLIDAQYTFDNSKLLFYFTSAGRVDFRVLVKDLASVFRTRIELRQIGIRDEAKLLGGIGMCGRPLCCSRFLSDFGQVSIKMAKEQNLSLNSAKISGICGRLMCCLRYEQKTYEYEIKQTPPVDSVVRTADGNGTVTEINPLAGTVKVRLHVSPEVAPKTYSRDDVILLKKKKAPVEEEKPV